MEFSIGRTGFLKTHEGLQGSSDIHIYRFGANGRSDPKRNDWPGPADTNVPIQPTKEGVFTNGRRTKFPKNKCPKPGEKIEKKEE